MTVLFDDLSVSRGGRTVLHGVDLEVGTGRIVGLLGPTAAASPRCCARCSRAAARSAAG